MATNPMPYTFGTATSAIPLSQLDTNFATPITLGNTAVYLNNTYSSIGNLSLANVTITSGTVAITNVSVTTANVSGTANISTLVVVGNATVGGNATITGNITSSTLTSGRVPYATTSGRLTDSANLLYSGTDLTVYGLTVGLGAGAVVSNTAVGLGAIAATATGGANTGLGWLTLTAVTSGAYNTGLGARALNATNSGSNNTGVGEEALYKNQSGSTNTAVGVAALYNTTASNNTAVGYQAGYNATGTYNVFIGHQAGYATTGSSNTFVGKQSNGNGSGELVTIGSKNSIFGGYNGNQGGLDIRTADNYIVLSDGDGNPSLFWTGASWRMGNYTGAPTNISLDVYHTTGSSSGASFFVSRYNGTQIGDIAQSGTTAVAYNTTSDYRLKENVQPLSGALARVAALKPCTYTWKSAPDEIGEGFIAHELAEVCPQAVTGQKDAVDEDGNAKYQSIDTSFLVATLTAAIQELKAEVDSLKSQLNGA